MNTLLTSSGKQSPSRKSALKSQILEPKRLDFIELNGRENKPVKKGGIRYLHGPRVTAELHTGSA